MYVYHRSDEILKLWVIARFGSDIFLGGKDSHNASFGAIDNYFPMTGQISRRMGSPNFIEIELSDEIGECYF